MEVPKIYLETTMFSFYYGQETTPEYRQYKADSRVVFGLIKAGLYEAFSSPLATDGLTDEPNGEKRRKMLALIPEYGVKVLFPSGETQRLAELYIREDVVSPAWETDAAHIAMTEEKTAFHRKRTDAMFASLGLPLPEYVNLSGQGKQKPRQPVTQ